MEKKYLLAILLLFFVLLVFGCTQTQAGQDNGQTNSNNATQNASGNDYSPSSQAQAQGEKGNELSNPIQIIDQNSAPSETVKVSIQNFAFGEASISIPLGTTVTWTNNDSVMHTVTADNGEFDSGLIGKNETYTFTFDTPGTYSYYCKPHPYMKGKITVQ